MRIRAAFAAPVVALLSCAVVLFGPAGDAMADTAFCASDACTPAALDMMTELATGNSTLTLEQQAAFDTIANANTIGSGATPAVLTGVAPPSAEATAAGFSWLTQSVPFLALLGGGVGAFTLSRAAGAPALPNGSTGGGIDANSGTFPASAGTPTFTISPTSNNITAVSLPAGSVDVYYISRSTVNAAGKGAWNADWAFRSWHGDSGYPQMTYVNSSTTIGEYGSNYYIALKYLNSGLTFYTVAAPQTITNPSRWVEQTITCTNSSGGSVTSTLTGPPSDFSGNVGVAGITCPTGTRASSWSAKVKTAGGPDVNLGGVTSPDTSSIPQTCFNSGITCGLRLQISSTTGTTTTWQTCHVGVTSACTDWMTQPGYRNTFRCQMGTGTTWAVVPIASCSTMAKVFQPNPTQTPHKTDPGPASDPNGCGIGWGDLLTGAIVYKAVSCALAWAFVPAAGQLATAQGTLSGAFSGSIFGDVFSGFSAWFTPFGVLGTSGGDCNGPDITINNPMPVTSANHLPSVLVNHWHPWAACANPALYVSNVWIGLSSFVTYFAASLLGLRAVLGALGMGLELGDDVNGAGEAEMRAEQGRFRDEATTGLKSAFALHAPRMGRVERARRTGN